MSATRRGGASGSLKIGVVCGGTSAEAAVSRSSAAGVRDALVANFPHVELFELNDEIGANLTKSAVDVVFPVLHGPPGEDGTFQGFLEILGIPYVGSGVLASACALNKVIAKEIFRAARLPIARHVVVRRSDWKGIDLDAVIRDLGDATVVKPSGQGSALGVGFAQGANALRALIETAMQFGGDVLVEERIRGMEITVAVLERPSPEALPVVEVRTPKGSWYDYEHRYTVGLSEHVIPAALPAERLERCQEVAVRAHEALECRDLSRADFVVPESGEPILLEVNTLPGMTPTSLYPDAARAAGLSFEALVAHLVRRAAARGGLSLG